MSAWLQSLGQFFWVFVIGETNNLECYKVMGETVEAFSGELLSVIILALISILQLGPWAARAPSASMM